MSKFGKCCLSGHCLSLSQINNVQHFWEAQIKFVLTARKIWKGKKSRWWSTFLLFIILKSFWNKCYFHLKVEVIKVFTVTVCLKYNCNECFLVLEYL
jgi:hypothetical protein